MSEMTVTNDEPAPGEKLLEERFDAPSDVSDWDRFQGALLGRGPWSVAAWDDEALKLEGEANTKRWQARTQTVPTKGARCVLLKGRIRTEGLELSQAERPHCNLFVRYDDTVVPTRFVLEDTGQSWEHVQRRIELPEGVEEVEVGCFLSVPGTAWFDDVILEVAEPPQWVTEEVGRYRYHLLKGGISQKALTFNQETFDKVAEFLGVEGPEYVDFYKYPDTAVKEELTGRPGNAHVEDGAIHTVWETDNHEIVHVLADALGHPPALLGEGIAVYLGEHWRNVPLGAYARVLADQDLWIPPLDLLDMHAFMAVDPKRSYPVVGAFVGWMLDEFGRDTLLEAYRSLDRLESAEENLKRLRELLGLPSDAINLAATQWAATWAPKQEDA